MVTIDNFMNGKFTISLWKEPYIQIANYLFKSNANWDKNILFYFKEEQLVKAMEFEDDFLDNYDWEDFYLKNHKYIDNLIKPSKYEFENGIAGIYIENMDDIKKLEKIYGERLRKPNKIIQPFYIYYNIDKDIFDWELDKVFYGPIINIKDLT